MPQNAPTEPPAAAKIPVQASEPKATEPQPKANEPKTYKQLTAHQLPSGLWPSSAAQTLSSFFRETPQNVSNLADELFWTIVALCVLENVFAAQSNEWAMIAEKARRALIAQKVQVDTQIDLISDYLN